MIDPITVSVLTHRFEAIVQEMGEAMLRTAYSQILNSSRDFSTALCDAQARLIAQAEHVPIHVGALPFAAKAMTEFFRGDINPGDTRSLVLSCRSGQSLSANVSSRSNCVTFRGGGTSLATGTSGGDNYITVSNNCSSVAHFTVNISII